MPMCSDVAHCFRVFFAAFRDMPRTTACARSILQALKNGLTVLTRDVRDYDLLLQLVPSGRALFYRRAG
jgi:hypothetical protein